MNVSMDFLFVTGGIALTFLCIALFFIDGSGTRKKKLKHRIEVVRTRSQAASLHSEQSVKRKHVPAFPTLDRLAGRVIPNRITMVNKLAQTGRDISVGSFVMVCVVLFVMLFIAFLAAIPVSILATFFISIALGFGLPYMIVGRMGAKRIKTFTAQFPEAIDLIVRGLKSGLPVSESINAVGRDMADPVGAEFRKIADSVKFGQLLEDALWDTARRLDTAEFKFFVISLSVQQETGGNLSEALENLADILRRRRQMGLKVKAMSSEAKASAMILGSLPFIMFGIIFVMNPGYEMQLFTDPRGQIMLGFGIAIIAVGIAVMTKMVRFEI